MEMDNGLHHGNGNGNDGGTQSKQIICDIKKLPNIVHIATAEYYLQNRYIII